MTNAKRKRHPGRHAPKNENGFWNNGASKRFAQIRTERSGNCANNRSAIFLSLQFLNRRLVETMIPRFRIYCQSSKWCTRTLFAKFTNYIYRLDLHSENESIGSSGCKAKSTTPQAPDCSAREDVHVAVLADKQAASMRGEMVHLVGHR